MDVKAFIQKQRPLLDILAGSHEHDSTDGVWRDLLAFPTPLTGLPPVDLQVAVGPFCDQLGVFLAVPLASFGLHLLLG